MSLELKVGGGVDADYYVYIERDDDERLLRLLLKGEYANVLTSRQMGKTSLMNRTIAKLGQLGVRTVAIDMAAELHEVQENAQAYFRALVQSLSERLEIEFDVDGFSRRHGNDAPGQWLQRFFREIVAPAINAPLVIFLDEIDSTIPHPYTDGLFTAIRGMYNERTLRPVYRNITFCLLGVASPNQLIKKRGTTPYNIGETLVLRDFDPELDNLEPLARQLSADTGLGWALLRRVLDWSGGQPYLTVKLCRDVKDAKIDTPDGMNRHVQNAFKSLARLENDIHFEAILRFVEDRDRFGAATESLTAIKLRGITLIYSNK